MSNMEETKQNTYLKKFYKIFPIFYGLSDDLLFYVAIDTLFYTIVKGFSADQLALLTTVSSLFCILLKVPITKIIEKIGNTKSIRIGTLGLIVTSVIITFSGSFLLIMIARILYLVSIVFKNMDNTMLKNNLILQNKEDDYAKIISRANTIYATITMIIAFIAGYIFNIKKLIQANFGKYLKEADENSINIVAGLAEQQRALTHSDFPSLIVEAIRNSFKLQREEKKKAVSFNAALINRFLTQKLSQGII